MGEQRAHQVALGEHNVEDAARAERVVLACAVPEHGVEVLDDLGVESARVAKYGVDAGYCSSSGLRG